MVWPPIHLFWKYILRETIHFGVPTGTPGPSFILLHWWKHLYFATASLHNLEEKHSSPRNRHSYHWILLRLHWGAFQSRSTACLGHKSTWIPSTAHSQGFKLQNIHILLWLQKKTHPSSKFCHPGDLCWVLIILQSNSQPPQPLLLNPGFNVGLKPDKFHTFERGLWTTLIFCCLSHPKWNVSKKLKQGWSVVNHDHWPSWIWLDF